MLGSHSLNTPESIGLTMNFKRFPAAAENRFYEESKDKPEFARKNPAKGDTDNLSIQSARHERLAYPGVVPLSLADCINHHLTNLVC